MDVEEILKTQGYLDHIDLLETLRQNLATVVFADERGVLLKVGAGGAWVLTVFEVQAASRFVSLVEHDGRPVCCHQDFCVPLLEKAGFCEDLRCHQAAYLKKELFAEQKGVSFRRLSLPDEPLVLEHYHLVSPSYVHERIEKGILEGVLLEGELVGFMGLHVEGAMGMLEIFPQARRMGLASALERHFCNRLLREGCIPYCHIVQGNEASLSLHEKLGFTVSQSSITWLD
jgi:tRNA (guanine37-N1)-methyltransferase